MLYKYLLLITTLIFTISCDSNHSRKEIINLENTTTTLHIKDFYLKEIHKYNIYQEQNKAILYGKTANNSETKSLQISDFYKIQTTDIFNHNKTTNTDELIGTQYNMLSYSSKDTIAKYGPTCFYKMDMMIDTTKNFMGVVALAEDSSDTNAQQLIQYISKKEGSPKEQIEDFFGEYKLYTWKNKENLLAVVSRPYTKEITSNKGKELFKDDKSNSVEETVTLIYFYTIPLKYAEIVTQQLYTGNWLFLKS